MKLTVLAILIGIMQSFAIGTYAQVTKLNLNMQNSSIKEVLARVEEKTEFFFLYNSKLVDVERKVDVAVNDMTITDLLNQLFADGGTSYNIVDRQIVLSGRDMPAPTPAIQQQGAVTGTVTDRSGSPLPGVTVVIKGTTTGTITGSNGNFSLTNVPPTGTLVFSFVGMRTQEVVVGNQSTINISLLDETFGIEEVIAIGYGTTTRKEFTGSVGSIRLEDSPVALAPNTNVLESLKGNVTGLNIGATNVAGGEPSMIIRGQNSISGSNNPLIVLDGVIYLGSLSDINPNDIATVDVLKDAVSASVYGSRAANGVIAITTKRGKSQKPVISFNSSAGIQTYWEDRKLLTGEEWVEAANRRENKSVGETAWMYTDEAANYAAGRATDWVDKVTQMGVTQDYQLSVSGAGERMNYYLSTAYNDNKGVIIGDDFNRISVLGKIDTEITSWLKIGVDAAYSKRDYSGFPADLYVAQRMTPYGTYFRDDMGNLEKWPMEQSYTHPLWGVNDDTQQNSDIRQNFRLNTYALVEIPWVKGLSYRLNYSNTNNSNNYWMFRNENYFIAEGVGIERYGPAVIVNYLSNTNGNTRDDKTMSYVWDNILNYKNSFGNHNVDLTTVYTIDELEFSRVVNNGSDFAANGNSALGIKGLDKASVQTINYSGHEVANIGYLARASYNFSGKYFVSGSFRRDGASVFGTGKKWANFAGIGLAWNITNEDFFEVDALDNLKLKVAWGQNGNQGIGPYSTLSQVQSGASARISYVFASNPDNVYYGLRQTNLGNSQLGWEKTDSWNVGFESEWLGSRLFVDLDVYSSKTTDQIFQRTIPSMAGFSSILTSLGRVDNSGSELTVRSVNIQKSDFTWNSALTFWKNWNKLKKLYGEDLDGDGIEDDDIASGYFIGHSLGAIYGFEQIGVVQEEDTEYIGLTGAKPGYPKYNDIDGEPGISANDRKILGFTKPNFSLNLSNTVSYIDFELYFMVQGIFGGNNYYLRSNAPAYQSLGFGSRFNSTQYDMPYWTPENRSNEYLIPSFGGDGRFLGLQSRGFVRLQDLSLSYRFNQPWVNDMNISTLKVFFAAKNLFTITNWDGDDPEIGSPQRSGTYPAMTTYSLGFNISF